jgi:protein TonB
MPSFPGGEKALFSFIQKYLQYPNRERELGIEGKAVISFVIDPRGKVTDVKTLRADSKGFSKASENVIGHFTQF